MSERTRTIEIWRQDPENPDLWHGAHGVIINTAALEERKAYFDIVKLQHCPAEAGEPLRQLA